MTDAEFIDQVRRGLLMIIRACMKRYRLSWADLLPRDMAPIVSWVGVDETIK